MGVIRFELLAIRRALSQGRSAEARFDQGTWSRYRRPFSPDDLADLALQDVTEDARWASSIDEEPMVLGVYVDRGGRHWQVRLLGSLRGERWVIEPIGTAEAVEMRYGMASDL